MLGMTIEKLDQILVALEKISEAEADIRYLEAAIESFKNGRSVVIRMAESPEWMDVSGMLSPAFAARIREEIRSELVRQLSIKEAEFADLPGE